MIFYESEGGNSIAVASVSHVTFKVGHVTNLNYLPCRSAKTFPKGDNRIKNGDMTLPPSPNPPDLLKRLFSNNSESSLFLKNIRQYNSAFAFISIKYTPDRCFGLCIYNTSFQIQGELHHLQSPFIPRYGADPVYAQYFIYDPDEVTRLRATRNTGLSLFLFRDLDGMIRQFNPFYKIYKTAREVLKKISDFQETRLIISPRLNLIIEKGADRRRENLLTAHEIPLLIPGKNDKPGNRDLILTTWPARSNPNQNSFLQQISYIYPLYHTLYYVFSHLFGEPGRDFSMEL